MTEVERHSYDVMLLTRTVDGTIADADSKLRPVELAAYGSHLGMAFQVVDDLEVALLPLLDGCDSLHQGQGERGEEQPW